MLSIYLIVVMALAGFLWIVYGYVLSRRIPEGLKELPGPKGYPFIGSVLDFPETFHYHKFKEWSDQYGPICKVNIFGSTHVIVSDVDIANELLALRGANYSDRPPIVMLHEFVSGTGNLATNPVNKYWKNARRFAQAMLSNNSLQNWDDLQINEASRLTWDLLQNPDNYQYLFERYSTVIAITTMYGKTISGTPREAEDVEAIMAINRTLERTGAPGAYLVDLLPALRYLPKFLAPFKREGERLHKYEYSYFNGLLHAAERRHDSEKPGSARSFSEFYFDNKDYWDMTEFEITYCLGTLFEGSSGTTSAGMMSFCLAMYHHPEWQAKVQQELDEVVGNERLPSFDDWPKLPMVRAAMKETLRWRPVVPGGIPHKLSKDDEYNGFFIPKGAIIHANQFAMYRDEKLYPDPEAYNPDRWLNPKYPTFQEPLTQYPNLKRFSAFGFGRRICPGLTMAERSMFIEISTLMWAASVIKKLDQNGRVIPVPWYDYRPGNNTGPKRFDFDLKIRDERRVEIMKERNKQAMANF